MYKENFDTVVVLLKARLSLPIIQFASNNLHEKKADPKIQEQALFRLQQ